MRHFVTCLSRGQLKRMPVLSRLLLLGLFAGTVTSCSGEFLPVVINTWPFTAANQAAVDALQKGGSYLDAVELGCSKCEVLQCDTSVGYGGSPDELGNTTLDAMIMDGVTHAVGSVGCLTRVRSAISVARAVMKYSKHTLLVGVDANSFAVEMGFKEESLDTNASIASWEQWKKNNCQPNYRQNVSPDPTTSCGPYRPNATTDQSSLDKQTASAFVDTQNHDTIGMVVIDSRGNIACGTSTNGATHKIPGRVGDSPIAGAGAYVDQEVGGAAATGDGDVMMRFLPTYQTVESMRRGMSPTEAAEDAIRRIMIRYSSFSGAIIAVNKTGHFGAAAHGFNPFPYTVYNPTLKKPTVYSVKPIAPL